MPRRWPLRRGRRPRRGARRRRLRERISRAKDDPRARIRLVADGAPKAKEAAPEPTPGQVEKPTVTFADLGGLDELKEKIRLRVLYPLKRPDLYKAFGKKVGGGLLLYGPPGCGKTFLARATAGEAGIHFVAVGIEEVLDMWLGQSEKKLHELFKTARANAPAILFFDEVDSLGGRRSGLRHESLSHAGDAVLVGARRRRRAVRGRARHRRHQRALGRRSRRSGGRAASARCCSCRRPICERASRS